MNKTTVSAIATLLAPCLLFIGGCAKYNSQRLRPLQPAMIAQNAQEQVTFNYKALSKRECRKFLGKNVIKSGYQPVQITIENDSNRTLLFSPSDISIKTVPAEIVARKVYDRTTTRIVGWGISGLFIWPFLIPAIVDPIWSCEANQKLLLDYEDKAVAETSIRPGATLNGIVFVPVEEYRNYFTITLRDNRTNDLVVCKSNVSHSI